MFGSVLKFQCSNNKKCKRHEYELIEGNTEGKIILFIATFIRDDHLLGEVSEKNKLTFTVYYGVDKMNKQ